MQQSQTIIETEALGKSYQQGQLEVRALSAISLTIERGEFTVIHGPSGSGKTTLLNLLGALDHPSQGVIRIEGRPLNQLNRRQRSRLRRDRIGFVFQAYNLIPVLTAFENAESVLALQNTSAAERRDTVMQLLQDVGLGNMEHRRPDELSGGQQQRVAIARAIAAKPAMVLADEPTANVDSQTAQELIDLMQELNESRGTTFIFSTHYTKVMDHARRLIHLVDGRVDSDERH